MDGKSMRGKRYTCSLPTVEASSEFEARGERMGVVGKGGSVAFPRRPPRDGFFGGGGSGACMFSSLEGRSARGVTAAFVLAGISKWRRIAASVSGRRKKPLCHTWSD